MLSIAAVGESDLPDLMPLLRGYCDFYRVDPTDADLAVMVHALIADPREGIQLIARDEQHAAVGFATVFWTWQTLDAARIGVLNDLFVTPQARGTGAGRALIERCLDLCRRHGARKLVWETALDNETAQRLYDGIGAQRSTWLTYELDVG